MLLIAALYSDIAGIDRRRQQQQQQQHGQYRHGVGVVLIYHTTTETLLPSSDRPCFRYASPALSWTILASNLF
jgi:hypothetical protein